MSAAAWAAIGILNGAVVLMLTVASVACFALAYHSWPRKR